MEKRDVLTILWTTFMCMAVLYAPQPVFPLLAGELGVSETAVASLITWSLLPMAVVPLFGGVLMQVVPPRHVLAGSVSLLGVSEVAFAVTDVFWGLVALRFVQGALVATTLAATMTYVSLRATRLSRVMALYVSSSILGGLVGRLVAGYGASWAGSAVLFGGIGGFTLVGAVLAWGLTPGPARSGGRVDLSRLRAVLRSPTLVLLYGVIFSAFFVFTALLNFAPFRIADLGIGDSGATGLAYVGFLLGLVAALGAERVATFLGGRLRAVAVGGVLLGVALVLGGIDAFSGVIGAILAASAGFFLVHSVLSAYVNQYGEEDVSAVNGLYVAIYYAGGTAGSYVPGLAYDAAGWAAFLGVLAMVAAAGLALLGGVFWHQRGRDVTPEGADASSPAQASREPASA